MKKLLGLFLAITMMFSFSLPVYAEGSESGSGQGSGQGSGFGVGPGIIVSTTITPAPVDPTLTLYVEQGGTLNLVAYTTVVNKEYEPFKVTCTSEQWTGADLASATNVGVSRKNFTSRATVSAAGKDVGDKITVTYMITVRKETSPWYGTDTETVNVLVTLDIYVAPMAAPAIAAHILKYNDVSPTYVVGTGKSKFKGNFIADVAKRMESNTDFEWNGIVYEKGTDESNPYYRDAVYMFLKTHSNMPESVELVMPPLEYWGNL